MLYIVATPIGNLEDITYRAVRVLGSVATVACEDTRVTRRLLAHYGIDVPTVALHQHTSDAAIAALTARLTAGEDMALVTDAGTPGVSDPGNQLVAAAVAAGVAVSPVPGPSALAALVSVAGIDMQRFLFLAYPPHKKGRETFMRRVADSDVPVVYYDSVHRVVKNLTLLGEVAPDVRVIIGRELTKMFEEIVRGSVADVLAHYATHPDRIKGEFVVIVHH